MRWLLRSVSAPPKKAARCVRLCYTVFVANTTHISIRLPADLVAELRAEAVREDRSLAWVIAKKLGGGERRTQQSAVPELDTAHYRRIAGSNPARPTKSLGCPSCGAIGGLHQRGLA